MGYRVGIDAFTAAVLGGIGSLLGSVLGGILIGLVRALSDQYIATEWTNTIVFSLLITVLVFRPSGLLVPAKKEKV
jgi:branched-chain amino acid transport system permease protein